MKAMVNEMYMDASPNCILQLIKILQHFRYDTQWTPRAGQSKVVKCKLLLEKIPAHQQWHYLLNYPDLLNINMKTQ
jgi:hypothetical protein